MDEHCKGGGKVRLNTISRLSIAFPSRCCEPVCTEEILRYRHICNTHTDQVPTFQFFFLIPLEILFAKTPLAKGYNSSLGNSKMHQNNDETHSGFHAAWRLLSRFNRGKIWVPWGFDYRKPAVALEEDRAFPEGAGGVCAW